MASDAFTRLAAAKLFLQLPEDTIRWSDGASAAMRDPKAFLPVDFGSDVEEIVEKWNYIFEGETWLSYQNFGKGDPEGRVDGFAFRGATAAIPYSFTRDDSIIEILTLNRLVEQVIEIRLCPASTGNSDWCYLPLFHAEWVMLENEYGQEYLGRRLVELSESLDQFLALLELS